MSAVQWPFRTHALIVCAFSCKHRQQSAVLSRDVQRWSKRYRTASMFWSAASQRSAVWLRSSVHVSRTRGGSQQASLRRSAKGFMPAQPGFTGHHQACNSNQQTQSQSPAASAERSSHARKISASQDLGKPLQQELLHLLSNCALLCADDRLSVNRSWQQCSCCCHSATAHSGQSPSAVAGSQPIAQQAQ